MQIFVKAYQWTVVGGECLEVEVYPYCDNIIDLNESLSFITSQRWGADGRLTLLNLNDNQISHIPPSIASLTELNHLWLGNNQISEDIFQYITTLTNFSVVITTGTRT